MNERRRKRLAGAAAGLPLAWVGRRAFAQNPAMLKISHQFPGAAIVGMHLSKWLLLAAILLMVVIPGFFLPPVSIILMTAPIVLPPLKAAGFDFIWFGVLMTIVMEMGLIHPPVGLNIFVIKNIAPDIPLRDVMLGALPFVGLICNFPGIANGFPDFVMGLPTK